MPPTCTNAMSCTVISDCLKSVSSLPDGWTEHQCFDLKSCLEEKYAERVLYQLKFRRLEFGNRDSFSVDEFILIDTSMTGFGTFEGKLV